MTTPPDGRKDLIELRRDTFADWFAVNPVLGYGEPGYDRDANSLRIGDGTTPWASRPSVGSQGAMNVRDFGAKGDATTNDTAAIQRAIDALGANGGEVYFPAAVRYLTGPLTVAVNGVTFRGANYDASMLMPLAGNVAPLVQVNASYFEWFDLGVDGNNESCIFIDLFASSRDTIDRANFINSTGAGSHVVNLHGTDSANSSHANMFSRIRARNIGGTVINGASWAYDCQMVQMWLGIVNKGISMPGGGGQEVIGVHIWNAAAQTMELLGQGDRVEACYLEHSTAGRGLVLTAPTNAVVKGNFIWGNGAGGIRAQAGSGLIAVGNVFRDNVGPCIQLDSHTDAIIDDNYAMADSGPVATNAVLMTVGSDYNRIGGLNRFPGAQFTGPTVVLTGDNNEIVSLGGRQKALAADFHLPPSSISLVDVNDLFFDLPGNEVWQIEGELWITGPTTADIRLKLNYVPTGQSGSWRVIGGAAANSSGFTAQMLPSFGSFNSTQTINALAGPGAYGAIRGKITTPATGGRLQLQTAQGTSDPGDVVILAGSWLNAKRVLA